MRSLSQLPLQIGYWRQAVTCARPGTPPDVCQGLYRFWLDGLFIALSFSFYSAFMALWILGFGASNAQVGLMTSLSSVCGIGAFLVAVPATRRIGGRKRMVVLGRTASRLMLLAIAAVPFLASGTAAVYLTILLVCVQVIIENVSSPAWTGLVADIVPLDIRARYIASRNIAKSAARTIGVAIAGQVIRSFGFPGGYQLALVLATVVGLGAAWAYSGIPVDEDAEATAKTPVAMADPKQSRALWRYAAARTVWTLGYMLAAPFYSVYVVTQLGGNEAAVGLLSSTGAVAAVAGMLLFGRAVERFGLRRSWLVSGLLECVVPLLWITAPGLWFAFVPAAIDGLLIAGLELVNLNTLLGLTSPQNRTSFIAANAAILSVATMLGPIAGGVLSDSFGFDVAFGLASAIGVVGWVLYLLFVPDPYPTGSGAHTNGNALDGVVDKIAD